LSTLHFGPASYDSLTSRIGEATTVQQMDLGLSPGALLGGSYTLPRGPRVRLRLARPGDEPAIRALVDLCGGDADELDLVRLVRSDPRRRVVICAMALVDSTDQLVGVGAIDVESDAPVPETIGIDDRLTSGLDELLAQALTDRATALARERAA
jgi:hypothetical protein